MTRYEPDAAGRSTTRLAAVVRERHADTLFSSDGMTVDEQVAALLRSGRTPHTVATAESCTGGLLAARLTDRPGSSAYFKGAIVAYDNDVKTRWRGCTAELIERHGAVSAEVADALADGRARAPAARTSASA